jgi:hypothetical protein
MKCVRAEATGTIVAVYCDGRRLANERTKRNANRSTASIDERPHSYVGAGVIAPEYPEYPKVLQRTPKYPEYPVVLQGSPKALQSTRSTAKFTGPLHSYNDN